MRIFRTCVFAGVLTATGVAQATVTTFSGGDPGEGLDLTGTFPAGYAVYAGDVAETSTYQIQDAVFENSLVAGGIDITAANQTTFGNPNYGATTNDTNLSNITNWVRFGGQGSPSGAAGVTITAPVVTGQAYKLQLLFNEACCTGRGFDVYAEGNLVDANFNSNVVQNRPGNDPGPNPTGGAPGALITYDFTAGDNQLNVELRVSNPPFGDSNAIIDAVSLETVPEPGILGVICLGGIAVLRRRPR